MPSNVSEEKDPFAGISKEGVSIDIVLKKQQTEEKAREAEAERKATIIEMARLRPKQGRVYYPAETKRVSRRVRHLSDREIRKEYGLMVKPHKTMVENILWVIIEKGPVTSKEICAEIGEPLSSVSSRLTGINKRLGGKGGIIECDTTSRTFRWKVSREVSVESAYRMYLNSRPSRMDATGEVQKKTTVEAKGDLQETVSHGKPPGMFGIPENINIKVTWDVRVTFEFLKE